jgi:hypothetical protein
VFVEESIVIDAGIDRVWETFTDITCWKDWSKTLEPLPVKDAGKIIEGARLKFCIRPFSLPVTFEPEVQEVLPNKRILWTGSRYGIHARHEFLFEEVGKGVRLTSRETFVGLPLRFAEFLFPRSRILKLTRSLLLDLKNAVESGPRET